MSEAEENEYLEIADLSPEQWMDYAGEMGWSDGLPMMMPTAEAVERLVARSRGENEPFPPVSPRQVVPTLASLAANAVMAGCRPEYFPAVLAGLRAVLTSGYNLHGTLATTHPCAPMLLFNGPLRKKLDINCEGNCLGQGWRANATIGRALQLILLNIGGATPGVMDRATHGSPAKYSYCFAENEEASPWEPYHVRRGFAASDNVVTAMAAEGPHNVNDHGSTTGTDILTTIAGTISQVGTNNIYGRGPYFVVIGPEHAQTLHRDGWSIPDIQSTLYERSKVHISRVSKGNRDSYAGSGRPITDDHYHLSPSPDEIHVVVAGGAGKHSAFIPSFGSTEAPTVRVSSA